MSSNLSKIPRIDVVDALRGFAVMAILLVHSLEHFIFPVYPDAASQPGWLNSLDQTVLTLVFSLFAGKAYAIFALLFGFTFYVQYSNQERKGKDFGYRFLWRLLLLVGFATLNAAFFPAGDVLLLFAIVGIALFIVRKWSNRAVLITAALLLFQPVEWFHSLMGLFDTAYTLPDLHVGAMYEQVAAYTKEGNFWAFIYGNITLGQKASLFWAIGAGRFMQIAGLFMLGLLIGRKQLFLSSEGNAVFWVKTLIVSAILFGPLYGLKVQYLDNHAEALVQQTVGTVFDMWQKLAFTGILVASFVLCYRQPAFQRLTFGLRYYGRMSLTNYVSQSIAGALIYFPIGLYLAPYAGYTVSLLIGIMIFLAQLFFCQWWLRKHKQGILESIWHKATWLKR